MTRVLMLLTLLLVSVPAWAGHSAQPATASVPALSDAGLLVAAAVVGLIGAKVIRKRRSG